LITVMFLICALLVAVLAALIIALPLFRAGGAIVPAAANDAEVYRDQLGEVDRDQKSGLINQEEATQARAEIARRLIAASESAASRATPASGRATALGLALFLCLFLPAAAYMLYSRMGSPMEPDQPLMARFASRTPDINILIAKTEAHLASHPDDGTAWELLAPIYMRGMRADQAANAWKNAIRTLGPNADRFGSFGEALAAQAQGQITKEARDAFEQALKLEPKNPRSRFYIALADAQAGAFDKALAEMNALKRESPPDAPWQDVVDAQIDQITAAKNGTGNTLGNPNQGDIEAAAGMNSEDRMQMIRTMVEGLDARLTDDPNNFEGWMRLVRSYGVLKEPEKAADALKRALLAFPATSDNGKALLALAKDMGIATEGSMK
jgi:cytochrome c-type biogenesis protein CcmH